MVVDINSESTLALSGTINSDVNANGSDAMSNKSIFDNTLWDGD